MVDNPSKCCNHNTLSALALTDSDVLSLEYREVAVLPGLLFLLQQCNLL